MNRSITDPGSNAPTEILEMRAAQQRQQLHNSVAELRTQLKERLDLRKNARQYFAPAAGAVALAGLLFGYGFAGIFSH
jgi:hypothetical protein